MEAAGPLVRAAGRRAPMSGRWRRVGARCGRAWRAANVVAAVAFALGAGSVATVALGIGPLAAVGLGLIGTAAGARGSARAERRQGRGRTWAWIGVALSIAGLMLGLLTAYLLEDVVAASPHAVTWTR